MCAPLEQRRHLCDARGRLLECARLGVAVQDALVGAIARTERHKHAARGLVVSRMRARAARARAVRRAGPRVAHGDAASADAAPRRTARAGRGSAALRAIAPSGESPPPPHPASARTTVLQYSTSSRIQGTAPVFKKILRFLKS